MDSGSGARAASGCVAASMLSLMGIHKRFPGVHALRGASLDLRPGEIHALVGENGAGKSTLIKVMTGAHQADSGRILLEGRDVEFSGPIASRRSGIAAIYQEFNLIPALPVRENLLLGLEGGAVIRRGEESRRAREVLEMLGAAIDPEALVGRLNVPQQQLVEIGRALLTDARVLIMDEPTAALTPREVDRLFEILKQLKSRDRAVLFITHRLNEVLRISDRITVMRDGSTLGTWPAADMSRERMIELMVGRPVEEGRRARREEAASVGSTAGRVDQGSPHRETPKELLRVEALSGGIVRNVSFALRAGEILGLAGLVGAGRTELARLLFGADRPESGTIRLEGTPVQIRSPRDAIRLGICLLTEDRKGQGLILGLSGRENFALPNLGRWSGAGWIDGKRELSAFLKFVEALHIRVSGPEQPAGHLSGGNQQKLLVARWLESDSKVLLFDEPTRGIDVGAKAEMYDLLRRLADEGKGILVISSELPEILALSDRILVMRSGEVSGEIEDAVAATQESIMELAAL